MEILTSTKNPKVSAWRSLKEKKGREEQNAFLVEGTRMVREALSSSFEVRALLLREDYQPDFHLPETISTFILSDSVFHTVCDTRTPQGIAAVLTQRLHPLDGPHLLALDGLQDPGNVGTIIRTADAAGLDGVILSRDCVDLFSPKVLRSTMGSIFRLGFAFPKDLPAELDRLKAKGYAILSS